MTSNEITNRQSELSGAESGTPRGQGFILKQIAIALLEIAKELKEVSELYRMQGADRL